jgi:lysine 6-dehydrogenase
VTVSGVRNGKQTTVRHEMIDRFDQKAGMTSMMRTTAFPTSIIAQMVARGDVAARGVVPPEQCVPLVPFIAEMGRRNIEIHESLM